MKSGSPEHVALWDAINDYASSCRGDPSKHVYGNLTRMRAVVEVEKAVREIVRLEVEEALRANEEREFKRAEKRRRGTKHG